ncbi:MAG: TRAM domain-containing protein [Candidatus ainarchaeum sp.]|nr:TRAM domain-containing protein [Candidatus ainarchaeum sp.]MDD4278297.1 TRAM domain-containing protein [Candidatus Sumerlaeales bacterium]
MANNKSSSTFSVLNIISNPVNLTRLFFSLITTLTGYWVGRDYVPSLGPQFTVGAFFFSLIVILVESACSMLSGKNIALALIGLTGGLFVAGFVYPTIPIAMFGEVSTEIAIAKSHTLCNLVFGYLGIMLCLKNASRISFSRLNFIMTSPYDSSKVLDSSVIIDGRIKLLVESGFMQGTLLVPSFIVQELQFVADSADPQRRARGRRGLDILEELQRNNSNVRIWDKEYPDIKPIDLKLIAAARDIGAELVTNDINLQKVASVNQLKVLNINELSHMLKPVINTGDELHLLIVREGKEDNQGVGYLEDGTMVVVEAGRNSIGKEVTAQITSIVPTMAGRLVFAKCIEEVDSRSTSSSSSSLNSAK